jgi:DinB superfamily
MDRQAMIEQYAAGHAEVCAALAGAKADDLDVRPAPDAWTAREVVHHLADSETNSYVRLRKLLAEDDTVIYGYDQDEWARRLRYDLDIEAPLAVLGAVRTASTALLRTLTEADFARTGMHTESGPYSVDTWLSIYAAHAHDHADQIRRARQGLP